MSVKSRIQSCKDKISNLLRKKDLSNEELHELNRLYNDLQFYLEHDNKETDDDL